MRLVKKGFLSGSTSRVSAMASVLGTSRGSGGLSSQLRCKSKRRRRRRSKRKGKDAVPVPARVPLRTPLLSVGSAVSSGSPVGCWWGISAEQSARSSDIFANGWGLLPAQRGQRTEQRAPQSVGWSQWRARRGAEHWPFFRLEFGSLPVIPRPSYCLRPSGKQHEHTGQRKHSHRHP